ncbi:hypothetical protein FM105_09715 [Brevibacterium yomogidense]|uniref:Uncharacterized protein n=1 Tax=Brevibacterium yomogidense TaxID=946573 RepID=A0A1X6XI54_9MICO|nr:hypothetical protein FM105_09715 [Brevibacterium yomogidense]
MCHSFILRFDVCPHLHTTSRVHRYADSASRPAMTELVFIVVTK